MGKRISYGKHNKFTNTAEPTKPPYRGVKLTIVKAEVQKIQAEIVESLYEPMCAFKNCETGNVKLSPLVKARHIQWHQAKVMQAAHASRTIKCLEHAASHGVMILYGETVTACYLSKTKVCEDCRLSPSACVCVHAYTCASDVKLSKALLIVIRYFTNVCY